MQIMNLLASVWIEIKSMIEAALPMIVKIILGYLIIRFALVVANLIVQLAKAYSPPRPPAPRTPPMDAQVLAEGQPAEAAPPEESPALPESTSNT